MSIQKKYILISLLLFFIEISIAIFIKDKFVRPFLGDVLAVMLLFYFGRIFYKGSTLTIASTVFAISFIIEILQYAKLNLILGLENNKIATLILGATFDKFDLLSYFIGALFSYLLDKKIIQVNNQPNEQ